MSATRVRRPRRGDARGGAGRPLEPGIDLVAVRRLLRPTPEARVWLRPGDRPLVAAGDSVLPGTILGERLRDARLVEAQGHAGLRPGDRWRAETRSDGQPRRGVLAEGELLYETNRRWRIAAGDHPEPVESPVAGIIREVRPGQGIRLQAGGVALAGVLALGSMARGRVEIATDADGELLPRALDVGAAGAILVVGARIDAEALTRARAMGVLGIVVATLPSKDRRDYLASEARQRAALHRLPPFGVLVLHGSTRRPIAAPVMATLLALAGRDVAILGDPPCLVFDPDGVRLPTESPDAVHVRSGPLTGQAGRWAGLAGLRRFAGGTHLEAAFVRFGDEQPVAVPLADLERYG
jgi:hypothetical protein